MSASELLRQVGQQLKQLPLAEREKFLDGILNLEYALPRAIRSVAGAPLRWPDIHARHRRIFGDTVLAENVVLAAREEEEH